MRKSFQRIYVGLLGFLLCTQTQALNAAYGGIVATRMLQHLQTLLAATKEGEAGNMSHGAPSSPFAAALPSLTALPAAQEATPVPHNVFVTAAGELRKPLLVRWTLWVQRLMHYRKEAIESSLQITRQIEQWYNGVVLCCTFTYSPRYVSNSVCLERAFITGSLDQQPCF
jgi:hypothetical protein